MDLLAIVRLLWRQRWVVAVSAVVGVALLAVAVVKAPPKYEATGSVVLFLPPRPPDTLVLLPGSPEAERVLNPYVRFDDTSVVVDILRRVMVSDETAERLAANGVTGTYTVAANLDFYRGPIIDVSAEAVTEEAAVASTETLVEELESTLTKMQQAQGTDPVYFFRADVVVPPSKAKRILTGTLRRGIAAAAVSGFLVLGSAVVADSIAAKRRKGPARPATGGVPGYEETHSGVVSAQAEVGGGRLSIVAGAGPGTS